MVIRSSRVVLPDGVRPASVHVRDGRIVAVEDHSTPANGPSDVDAGDLLVLPGLVDTHVHINDPGRADWEGFEHATRAAAAGGITTLVDMPLNSIPPTTTIGGLAAKRESARGRVHVDVGFWGGVIPGNDAEIAALARAGVLGFKCFLSPSGVDEFPCVSEDDLRAALPVIAPLGLPLLVHAEMPALLRDPLRPRATPADPRRYATWLESRPPAAEVAAIEMLVDLAREHRARIHVVHLATASGLAVVNAARSEGLDVTVETCPHYLTFAAEEIADGATAFKCAPPIRSRAEREALWDALRRDDIDLVATDHSPAPPALKHLHDGDFVKAWGGIASLQLGFAALWTGAMERGLDVEAVVRRSSAMPARLAGLAARKGAIAAGFDADFVVWDPDAAWTVDASMLFHRHSVTPYAGRRLRGRVVKTIRRGKVIFENGECVGHPSGELVVP